MNHTYCSPDWLRLTYSPGSCWQATHTLLLAESSFRAWSLTKHPHLNPTENLVNPLNGVWLAAHYRDLTSSVSVLTFSLAMLRGLIVTKSFKRLICLNSCGMRFSIIYDSSSSLLYIRPRLQATSGGLNGNLLSAHSLALA